MKIGIIVYSQTGNTLSVAAELEQALIASGHDAVIEKIEPVHKNPNTSKTVELKIIPDVSPYEAVVFASPVHAFSLAPVMKLYLSGISNLSGKQVFCFVTQQLKKKWMGGNRAVNQIKTACKTKGADVVASGIVNWSSDQRDMQIEDIVTRFSKI